MAQEQKFSVTVIGDDKVMAVMDSLTAMPTVVEQEMKRVMTHLSTELAIYPAPPPNSTYTRTGTLGRRWLPRTSRGLYRVSGFVQNNTKYVRWVQDEDEQAMIHQGRWKTAQSVLEENVGFAHERITDAVRRYIVELISK